MILTKEVKVYYNGQARQYYESKGYIFPKQWVKFNHTHNRMVYRPVRGSYIIVPISDLNPNSNTDIEWKCDLCDNIGHTTYKRYLQSTKLYDGMKLCDQCRQKYLSKKQRGDKDVEDTRRRCVENTEFIQICLNRDNYTCKICGSKEQLQVHHLSSYAKYPQLRYEPTNGVTLCKKCHDLFHNTYGRIDFTKEDFIKFSKLNLEDFINNKGEVNPSRICYCYEDDEYIYNIHDYCQKYGYADTNLYQHLKRKIMAFHHKHYFWKDDVANKTREEIKLMVDAIEQNRKIIRKGDYTSAIDGATN